MVLAESTRLADGRLRKNQCRPRGDAELLKGGKKEKKKRKRKR